MSLCHVVNIGNDKQADLEGREVWCVGQQQQLSGLSFVHILIPAVPMDL